MKIQITFAVVALIFIIFNANAQKLDIVETDLNFREVGNFSVPVNHPSSACVVTVSSGLTVNTATTRVSSWSKTYTASPGYGGYGGISNGNSGLMIRANGPTGKINFLTGGTPLSFTRMTIDESGDIGIGIQLPREQLHVAGGNIYVQGAANGVILASSNGSCWKTVVSNGGVLSTVAVPCP